MAKLEIEIDDATGSFKELPEPLKKHIDGLADAGFKARHAELRTNLEKQFAEKYKPATTIDAADRERLNLLEDENQRFKTVEAERKAEYDKALKIREEADAKREDERQKAGAEKDKELQRQRARLLEVSTTEIKIAAQTFGAHAAGLEKIARLLGADIDLDADLKPFVKGADGQPAVDKDGNPVTIEGHVKLFLTDNPYFVASTAGAGGGARGGVTLTTTHLTGEALTAQRKVDAIKDIIAKGDQSDTRVNELYEANLALKKATSQGR